MLSIRRAALAAATATVLLLPLGGAVPSWSAQHSAALTTAGSIVFLRDHNVWMARGDGGAVHQVTYDGTAARPYVTPTMSDDGTIAAGHGHEIVFLGQNGAVRNRMDPPGLMSGYLNRELDGVVREVAISPDGQLVIYNFSDWGCLPGEECRTHYVSAFMQTHQPGTTMPSSFAQTYVWNPSWVHSGRVVQTGVWPDEVMLKDVYYGTPRRYFSDDDTVGLENALPLGDADISPDGRWLAAVRGTGADTRIARYAVRFNVTSGEPPQEPLLHCNTTPSAGQSSPTYSPDSTLVAWQQGNAIWVGGAQVGPGSCPTSSQLIANGRTPDWSAASYDPTRGPAPFPGTQPPTQQPPAQQPPTQQPPGQQPAATFTMAKKPQVRGVAKVGKVLRAVAPTVTPKPGKVAFRWLRNGKVIPQATSKSYRLTAADRGRRIAVRVTLTRSQVKALTVTSKATGKVRR